MRIGLADISNDDSLQFSVSPECSIPLNEEEIALLSRTIVDYLRDYCSVFKVIVNDRGERYRVYFSLDRESSQENLVFDCETEFYIRISKQKDVRKRLKTAIEIEFYRNFSGKKLGMLPGHCSFFIEKLEALFDGLYSKRKRCKNRPPCYLLPFNDRFGSYEREYTTVLFKKRGLSDVIERGDWVWVMDPFPHSIQAPLVGTISQHFSLFIFALRKEEDRIVCNITYFDPKENGISAWVNTVKQVKRYAQQACARLGYSDLKFGTIDWMYGAQPIFDNATCGYRVINETLRYYAYQFKLEPFQIPVENREVLQLLKLFLRLPDSSKLVKVWCHILTKLTSANSGVTQREEDGEEDGYVFVENASSALSAAPSAGRS